MKKSFFLLCLVFVCSLVFSQSNYEEVVYLKNGSIIHGMIVEFVPNISIKIKSGANLFVYKLDEIEKITRELPAAGTAGGFETKEKGYYGIVQVGLTDFPQGSNLAMASINIINGYQFNRYFSMGGGVGADISSQSVYNVSAFLDARVNFLKRKVTPFFSVGVGYNAQISSVPDYYSYNTSAKVYHGVVFNPAFGVKGNVSKKVALSLSVGYKLLGVKYDISNYYGYSSSSFNLSHGVTVLAGIHF